MKIQVDELCPLELRALSAFVAALADARETKVKNFSDRVKALNSCLRGAAPIADGGIKTAPVATQPEPEAAKVEQVKAEDTPVTRAKAKGKKETAPAVVTETPEATTGAGIPADNFLDKLNEEKAISHDDIRQLVGELSQAGKRNEAVGVIRSYPSNVDASRKCNGVGEINVADLAEVNAKLQALKA